MTRRECTLQSSYVFSPDKDAMGADSLQQVVFLKEAWSRYLHDPFERSDDLRGKKFEIILHDDGLHVTVREV